MNKPIFILGCRKSGSSLLRSLFDSHPELSVIPFELQYFKTVSPVATEKQNIDKIIDLVRRVSLTKKQRMGDSAMFGKMDFTIFREQLCSASANHLFDRYVDAVLCSIQSTRKRFVEKSTNTYHIHELQTLYPNAFFIHIVRNPYDNLVSLRNYYLAYTKKYPSLAPLLKELKDSYYNAMRNQSFVTNYYVVKYEELCADTENIMDEIASFCGIEFDEALTRPTALNQSWEGNSSRRIRFTGVNRENPNRWKNEIYDLEISAVNRALSFVFDVFDYENIERKKRFLPVAKEHVREFLRNRLCT